MNSKVVILICTLMLALGRLAMAQSTQVVLQPGPEGKDVWITDTYSYNSDYGVDDDKLQVGGWGDRYYSLIAFDISRGPATAASATLYLYSFSTPNDGTYISMYLDRVTQPWDENTGWYNKPAAVELTIVPAPVPNQWYAIDITSLYNGWKRGSYPNYGIQLRPTQWCCKDSANFRSSDYAVATYRPKLVIIPNSINLGFPLKGKTPYSAVVTSVLDHSVPSGYYTRDNRVVAYDNEVGSVSPYPYPQTPSVVAYKRADGKRFSLPLLNYTDDGASASTKDYLFYDGHSGYDYKANWHDPILAATDGVLCISTSYTAPNVSRPWRDTSKCPYGNDDVVNRSLTTSAPTSWDRWHMFYIVSPGGVYSTWYLHADQLDSGIWSSILQRGYATVVKSQTVGLVGNWGLGCTGTSCKHLHFEARTSLGVVVDPYGDGTTGNLWELKP